MTENERFKVKGFDEYDQMVWDTEFEQSCSVEQVVNMLNDKDWAIAILNEDNEILNEDNEQLKKENKELESDVRYFEKTYEIEERGLDCVPEMCTITSNTPSRKELFKENEQLTKELKVYRKLANCKNCEHHGYDWFDDGDEFEVCEKGNDVTEGICEDWREL